MTFELSQGLQVLERNLVVKFLTRDFRAPQCDSRLSLARICALTRR